MTEAEWLVCTDPAAMLLARRGQMSERKLRLFTVAVARLLWERMSAEQREAVEVGERLADGEATNEDRLRCVNALYDVFRTGSPADAPAHLAATAAVGCWKPDMAGLPTWTCARQDTADRQPPLLRDIFGNPFRPANPVLPGPRFSTVIHNFMHFGGRSPRWQFDPKGRTDTVASLARQMYDARDFSAMPVLADALQDAGCDNNDILNHCRGPGPHVRGCWVVDHVLGKA